MAQDRRWSSAKPQASSVSLEGKQVWQKPQGSNGKVKVTGFYSGQVLELETVPLKLHVTAGINLLALWLRCQKAFLRPEKRLVKSKMIFPRDKDKAKAPFGNLEKARDPKYEYWVEHKRPVVSGHLTGQTYFGNGMLF